MAKTHELKSPQHINVREYRRYILLIILVTVIELRTLNLEHFLRIDDLIAVAKGVVHGTPPWRAFQNRLLGPYLVSGLTNAFGSKYDKWYQTVVTVTTLSVNLVTFSAMRKLGASNQKAAIYTAIGAGLFVLLQDRTWLYIWDYFDVLLFTLFAYAVYSRKSIGWFVVLFVVELLNREVAIFVPVWMILSSIGRDGSKFKLKDIRAAAFGLLLIVAGSAWTVWIRNRLFIRPMDGYPQHGPHEFLGNLFQVGHNLVGFVKYSTSTTPAFDFLAYWIPVAIFFYLKSTWTRASTTDKNVAIVVGLMLISTICFAEMIEVRVFLVTIPLILFFHASTSKAFRCEEIVDLITDRRGDALVQ